MTVKRMLSVLARCLAMGGVVVFIGAVHAGDACPPAQALTTNSDHSDAVPDGRFSKGMLWKIETPDAAPSYLFGTIHLADRPITRLPPAVALALAKADRFAPEVVLDQQAVTYYQQQMFSPDAPNVDSLFDQPFRQRLLRLLAAYGVSREAALQLKPWAAFTLLARPKPTGSPTLDELLANTARLQGKPVRGLETVEELVSSLEDISIDHQRKILIDTACNRQLLARQAQELATRYLEQDLAGMLEASSRYAPRDKAVAESFNQRLLYDRNRRMLKRLQPLLEMGNTFAAVGALHLAGARGLLQGLKDRGYRVSAVY
ncbi:MAG: TraB/GumN family protein [Gammaproteobacteria bacterium]